ncbi:hypothetical protein NX059_010572 [Plenodomus lindquistii]|nr:hypothetical protein NX059_010572 [Plenodomus lindquistii]
MFTYAISFAALVAATARIAEFWDTPASIQGSILFFLVPSVLLLINAFGIEIYGLIEVIGGTVKMGFLAFVVVVMIAINQGAGDTSPINTSLWEGKAAVYDEEAVGSWSQAFIMSLSIAGFAYVGVEITAASALEARVTTARVPNRPQAIGRTVKFSAVYISFLVGCMYVLAGDLVSLNIKWDDPDLPQMSWVVAGNTPLASDQSPDSAASKKGKSSSAFVIVASRSKIPGLANFLNIILIFTALTCANTNLYVASRALFSLTRGLDGGPTQPWYTRFLAYFGKTNDRKVPLRALVASCSFAWIPFLHLSASKGQQPSRTNSGVIVEILTQMGLVGVVIVWACECWAYIRFYNCITRNREKLLDVPLLRRRTRGSTGMQNTFPYLSHGQPFTAYVSLIACVFILVVANGAILWTNPGAQWFFAAYLAPICFIALWIVLKVLRKGQWHLVDLSDGEDLRRRMLRLHEIRYTSAQTSDKSKRSAQNLWGLL